MLIVYDGRVDCTPVIHDDLGGRFVLFDRLRGQVDEAWIRAEVERIREAARVSAR